MAAAVFTRQDLAAAQRSAKHGGLLTLNQLHAFLADIGCTISLLKAA